MIFCARVAQRAASGGPRWTRAVKSNPANHLPALTLGGLGVSRILWLVSVSLFAVGLWLLDTFRFCRRVARLEKATGGRLLEGSKIFRVTEGLAVMECGCGVSSDECQFL